jgi:hypothetical protein
MKWPFSLPSNSKWRERIAWHFGLLIDVLGNGRSHAEKLYRWTRVEEPPEKLESNLVYVVGQHGHLWSAEFLCPCGCQAIIRLSLHMSGRPRWNVTQHLGGRVSLKPSIWRQVGCKSHFILHRGQIEFVHDPVGLPTPDSERRGGFSTVRPRHSASHPT